MKNADQEEPRLTEQQIREALERGAVKADKLLKELNAAHLREYSRAMALRLD